MCAISIDALPVTENALLKDGDKMKDTDSNKTDSEKSLRLMAGKSMRPTMMVPLYSPLVSSSNIPLRFQRLGMPAPAIVPPRGAPYSIGSSFAHRPVATSYSGYQPQMLVQPVPQINAAFPRPVSHYHQQPILPPVYNYAPYASNSYSSYGYRSTADEENRPTSIGQVDQPLQSSVHYTTRYIMKPQEYQADQASQYMNEYNAAVNSEYSASELMEPREVFSMGPLNDEIHRLDVMGMDDRMNNVALMPDSTDQVYWEMMNPAYMAKLGPAYTDQQHANQMSYRITEPSSYLSLPRPYPNLENTNWILPRGDGNVPVMFT